MDEAIINYIKRKYNLLIGERTAEEIKIGIGNGFSGCKITTGTKIKLGGFKFHTRACGHLANRVERDGGNFRADSVSTDYGDLVFTGHDAAPNNAVLLNITRRLAAFAG
jgi:hypothetical protein